MTNYKKNQGIRLATIILDSYLYGEVDKYELALRFNVSERTIYRDLSSLSLILEHRGNSKYGLSNAIEYHKMTSFFGVDKYLPDFNHSFLQRIPATIKNENVIIKFQGIEYSIKNYLRKYYDKIYHAIENKTKCNIFYKGKNRSIEPYKLICHNTVWYLNAKENDQLKSFSLSRIEWFDISKEKFSYDDNIGNKLISCKNPWVSDLQFTVKVSISNSISHYFKRRELLPDQKILHEENNNLVISCSVTSEKQILPLILYWIPEIKILEPNWLKSKLEANLINYLNQQ
ncbi:TPA: helix-turn-helix transcriptional regulator [Providencia alcalifaciens]